jgi:hypothetical protein
MTKPWPKILVIFDCQVRPGVDIRHMTAISRYIAAKRPEVIVCIGDYADMPSLSKFSMNIEKEGQRYRKDVESVHVAMGKMMAWQKTCKNYKPRLVMTLGNHEERIPRTVKENPNLEGVISMADLHYEKYGWEVHPFLKVVTIYGVEFSHFFASGVMGRPVSSAAALLRTRQSSAVMGHVQCVDMAIHPRTQKTAIFGGLSNLHDEDYLGPQGNSTRRQVIMLHEVRDGKFDVMFVSLGYLLRTYGSK